MKLGSAIWLGHLNIVTHKRRSVMLAVIIAATFSVVFAINSIIQGIKANVPQMVNPLDEYYLIVNTVVQDEADMCAMNPNKECDFAATPEAMQKVQTGVEQYGGTVIKELESRDNYLALPQEILQPVITQDMAKAGEKVPVALTIGQASFEVQVSFPTIGNAGANLRIAAEIKRRLFDPETKLMNLRVYPVGMMPGSANVSSLSLKIVDDDLNILNPILEMIPASYGTSFAVEQEGGTGKRSGKILVKFAHLDDAVAFAQSKGFCGEAYGCRASEYQVEDVYGNGVALVERLDSVQFIITGLSVILAVIAVIIMVFTSMRLIDQSAKTISLYHALGATRMDACLIYFCYLLELCALAAILAVAAGLGMAAGLGWMNREKLSTVLQLAYGVEGRTLWLLGWNKAMTMWVGVMLLMAPLGILFSLGHFSDKQLAKRLKS